MVFTCFSVGRDRSALWSVRRGQGRWEDPTRLSLTGRDSEREPSLSPDGKRLWFVSDAPAEGKRDQGYDLWLSTRGAVGEGWSAPVRPGAPINSETSEGSPDETDEGLYFVSGRPGGKGARDVYLARRTHGGFAAPVNLGVPVNTEGDEMGVHLTPDGRVMLIARADRKLRGRPDLYLSYRTRKGWSEPVPLPAPVNSPADEYAPVLTPDGRRLQFTRDVARNYLTDLEAGMDIVEVDACLLGSARPVRDALARMRRASRRD